MASKRPVRKPQREAVFLECDLDKSTKAQLVKWVEEDRNYFDLIERVVDSGIKVSLGYDEYNECFMCSLSQPDVVDKVEVTYILVGRGGNLLQALQSAMFKHFVVLDGNWHSLDRRGARKETDWS